jgi:hypothetical protein
LAKAAVRVEEGGCRIKSGMTIWRRVTMAKGQKKSNKEARKPKKEVKKNIAANPSTKGTVVKD